MTISAYPYNAVCLLETQIPGAGGFRGSGVIIGPHTILTASHMLWDADANAGATSFNVFPGYNSSSTADPTSGQLPGKEICHFYKVDDKGHMENAAASAYDFAIIDTSADLSSYGSFGLTANFGGGAAELTGYPSAQQHIQYKINGTVATDPNYNVWNYSNFTSSGGYSGGPIWINKGTAANPLPYVVGVASTTNHAARLTSADLTQIKAWQAADASLWNGTTNLSTLAKHQTFAKTLQINHAADVNDVFYAQTNDTFQSNGTANTFVFTSGFGHDRINDFSFKGADHDTISLPDTLSARLASIIAHGTENAQGDTTLHLGNHDTITVAGVSVAQLQHHKADFTFHA